MNLAFLFPGSGPYEALDTWVRTLARHSVKHAVSLARAPGDCHGADMVFVLTEANTFTRERTDQYLNALWGMRRPVAVVHNHDNPGVPTPGEYPSFCWTQAAQKRLAAYEPVLLRQPLFRPVVPFAQPPLHVATFGVVEWKKWTLEMADWARARDIPFSAWGPEELCKNWSDYIKFSRVRYHPYAWREHVEDLAELFTDASHFLFVLPPSKEGTGGSPTSPRYAGFFHRPVIVVDDEDTFAQDGFYVFPSLEEITKDFLLQPAHSALYAWGPDEYLDALVEHTRRFWQ